MRRQRDRPSRPLDRLGTAQPAGGQEGAAAARSSPTGARRAARSRCSQRARAGAGPARDLRRRSPDTPRRCRVAGPGETSVCSASRRAAAPSPAYMSASIASRASRSRSDFCGLRRPAASRFATALDHAPRAISSWASASRSASSDVVGDRRRLDPVAHRRHRVLDETGGGRVQLGTPRRCEPVVDRRTRERVRELDEPSVPDEPVASASSSVTSSAPARGPAPSAAERARRASPPPRAADDVGPAALELPLDQLRVRARRGQRARLVDPVARVRRLPEHGAGVQRVAPGVFVQPAGGLRRHRHAELCTEHGHVLARQRAERHGRRELAPTVGKTVVAHRHQDQHRAPGEPAGGEQQRAERVGVRQVGVVDDHDAPVIARGGGHRLEQIHAHGDVLRGPDRAPAARPQQLVREREPHVGLRLVAARAQPRNRVELVQEALDQGALPDARIAIDHDRPRAPAVDAVEGGAQRSELLVATDENVMHTAKRSGGHATRGFPWGERSIGSVWSRSDR